MRNLVLVFLFLLLSLLGLTLFVGVEKVGKKPQIPMSSPYLYNDPTTSIKNIHLTIFYFVPKDKVQIKKDTWQTLTDPHLKKLLEFHTIQFSGKSTITYSFFPEIITGNKISSDYEVSLNDDDPDALLQIKDELTKRVFTKGGDLSHIQREDTKKDTRNVYLIVFEGDGGAGNGEYSLISRSFLTDKAYEADGTTFLAHEFYHTLGLPDNYQKSAFVFNDNQKTTISLLIKKDVMGRVNIPLNYTYIDKETLKKMGL